MTVQTCENGVSIDLNKFSVDVVEQTTTTKKQNRKQETTHQTATQLNGVIVPTDPSITNVERMQAIIECYNELTKTSDLQPLAARLNAAENSRAVGDFSSVIEFYDGDFSINQTALEVLNIRLQKLGIKTYTLKIENLPQVKYGERYSHVIYVMATDVNGNEHAGEVLAFTPLPTNKEPIELQLTERIYDALENLLKPEE